MRLTELYNQARNHVMRAWSYLRFNPSTDAGRQAIAHELQRQGLQALEQVEVPHSLDGKSKPPSDGTPQPPQPSHPQQGYSQPSHPQSGYPQPSHPQSGYPQPSHPQSGYPQPSHPQSGYPQPSHPQQGYSQTPFTPSIHASPYPEYGCKRNDPLGCDYPQETLRNNPHTRFCSQCAFPVPLKENLEIRGRRGIYQIKSLLGKRGIGRLYSGMSNDAQPIVIKEYLLPNRSFKNLEDCQQRQETFVRTANVSTNDGKERDFRLIVPWEAIADEQEKRCYLMTKGELASLPSLGTYLGQNGAMTEQQVIIVCAQVLQTLEFLHGQKFQFASGYVQQGLVHGNLSLDSLLIAPQGANFFVYLCDLLLWEYLFNPTHPQATNQAPAEDLQALGKVGFYLLAGRTTDAYSGQPLDFNNPQSWGTTNPALKGFILELLGVKFATATQAREALRQLPKQKADEGKAITLETEETTKKRWMPWVVGAALVAIAVVGGVTIWGWIHPTRRPPVRAMDPQPRWIQDIPNVPLPNVPPGNFTYTIEQPGPASYVFGQEGLLSTRRSVSEELQARKPGLILQSIAAPDQQQAIAQVEGGTASFALVSQIQNLPLSNLESKPIAYDGLLIIVPFSYQKREQGLPKALRGSITLTQIRDLYTGKVKNWKEIGGPDLPVKLYLPTEPVAMQLFEQRILKTPEAIANFRNLAQTGQIQKLETFQTLQVLQSEFERNQIGGISFGFISKVFGQCGGYPLAIELGEQSSWFSWLGQLGGGVNENAIQPWIQPNGKPIDPSTDLCQKGSYRLAEDLLQSQEYPLSVPLVVIYPLENWDKPEYQIGKKIADMLRTDEGQSLLRETNVSPFQPLK